jgi:hypothetical protein
MNPDPTSLNLLHDVIAPPPVPWWPPAPGWYWLMGGLAFFLIVLAVRVFLRWQRNRYRREALAEWKRNEAMLADSPAEALAGFAELLKRAALAAWPREQVASLTGTRWLEFLDQSGSTDGFTTGPGAIMENAAYDTRGASTVDESRAREIAEVVRHWLKNHRVGKEPAC